MTIITRKYFLIPVSLILLINFLFPGFTFCQIIVDNCKSELTSCCPVQSDNDVSGTNKVKNHCCCEIKEGANQQAEASTVLTDIRNKILSNDIQIHTIKNINYIDSYELSIRPLSFHSPPETDLNILNSTFRI